MPPIEPRIGEGRAVVGRTSGEMETRIEAVTREGAGVRLAPGEEMTIADGMPKLPEGVMDGITNVIPAQAGSQSLQQVLDPGFRRGDGLRGDDGIVRGDDDVLRQARDDALVDAMLLAEPPQVKAGLFAMSAGGRGAEYQETAPKTAEQSAEPAPGTYSEAERTFVAEGGRLVVGDKETVGRYGEYEVVKIIKDTGDNEFFLLYGSKLLTRDFFSTSLADSGPDPFSYNPHVTNKYSRRRQVIPMDSVSARVAEVVVSSIMAGDGRTFSPYARTFKSGEGNVGVGKAAQRRALLKALGVRVIAFANEYDGEIIREHYLFQDKVGHLMSVTRSVFKTGVSSDQAYFEQRLDYSAQYGLSPLAFCLVQGEKVVDGRYTVYFSQNFPKDGPPRVFILDRDGNPVREHYFEKRGLYAAADNRIYDVIVVDPSTVGKSLEGRSLITNHTMLLVKSFGTYIPLRNYRSDELKFMTDGNGVVEKFQSYSIPGTNFEVVIAPKHFELYRRKFDTSGISENVFVLRLSPDGPERISRTEAAALCYDCLNGVGEHSEDQRTVRWVGDVTSRAGKTASGKDYTIFSRTLMVDGVPKKISMEAEDARSFEWMGEGLARELSKVPERAWVYTDEVEVYLYMADKYGLDEEGVAGSYDRYAHRIRIFGAGVREATGVDETIRHEFGHSLIAFAGDGKMSGEQIIAMILLAIAATGPEVEERYKGSTGSVHFQSSWEERFSEALKLYLGENPIFRVADTLMSSVIDMFLDPET